MGFYDRGSAPGKPKRRSGGRSRFYIPQGDEDEREVISLSRKPYMLWEHNYKGPNNKWNNWIVCLKENGFADECPICKLADSDKPVGKYHCGAISIIDCTPWEGDDGTVPFTKRICVAKGDTLGVLEVRAKQQEKKTGEASLQFLEFEVRRTTKDRSPGAGDMWDVIKQWDKAELQEKFGEEIVEEHDWSDVFAPPPMEEYHEIAAFFGLEVEGAVSAPDEGTIDY